jgi:hypothetical protein
MHTLGSVFPSSALLKNIGYIIMAIEVIRLKLFYQLLATCKNSPHDLKINIYFSIGMSLL